MWWCSSSSVISGFRISEESAFNWDFLTQEIHWTECYANRNWSQIRTFATKSLIWLVKQALVSTTAGCRATKKLYLWPYKIHPHWSNWRWQLWEKNVFFVPRFCLQYTGSPWLITCFFTVEAYFHWSGWISAQNDRCWSGINGMQDLEVPIHSQKIDVWCAFTASQIVGPTF